VLLAMADSEMVNARHHFLLMGVNGGITETQGCQAVRLHMDYGYQHNSHMAYSKDEMLSISNICNPLTTKVVHNQASANHRNPFQASKTQFRLREVDLGLFLNDDANLLAF
jgi:hypothetical protein